MCASAHARGVWRAPAAGTWDGMTSLVRLPLTITRSAVGLGFDAVRLVSRLVTGGGEDATTTVRDATAAAAPPKPTTGTGTPRRAPSATNGNGTATTAAPKVEDVSPLDTSEPAPPPAGAAPLPTEPEPAHVDTEAEEVASFGPADDVGATIQVDEPWDGYDEAPARDVVARLRDADLATKAAVLLYEQQGKGRQTVLEAART